MPKPLIVSAPNESTKQEWVHAIKSTIQKLNKNHTNSKRRRRGSLIETVLSDGVILEGVLMKKAVSAKVLKNWKQRIKHTIYQTGSLIMNEYHLSYI